MPSTYRRWVVSYKSSLNQTLDRFPPQHPFITFVTLLQAKPILFERMSDIV
jgi:hypothetical protein